MFCKFCTLTWKRVTFLDQILPSLSQVLDIFTQSIQQHEWLRKAHFPSGGCSTLRVMFLMTDGELFPICTRKNIKLQLLMLNLDSCFDMHSVGEPKPPHGLPESASAHRGLTHAGACGALSLVGGEEGGGVDTGGPFQAAHRLYQYPSREKVCGACWTTCGWVKIILLCYFINYYIS